MLLRSLVELGDHRLRGLDRRAALARRLGQRAQVDLGGLRQRLEVLQERGELVGGGVEVLQRRRLRLGGVAELRPSSGAARAGRWAGAAGRRRCRHGARRRASTVSLVSTTQRPTSSLFSARSPIVVSASVISLLTSWFCDASLASTRSVSRSAKAAGAAHDVVDVLGAAGYTGAELVEDDPQPLAVRGPQHVVDQVDGDRRGRLLDGDRRAVRELLGARSRACSRCSTHRSATAAATRTGRPCAARPKPLPA